MRLNRCEVTALSADLTSSCKMEHRIWSLTFNSFVYVLEIFNEAM